MTELTIVALPQADDFVNEISSEKIAHLTVLYLGEVADEAAVKAIFDFMEHTANTSLTRFGLQVDRRGTLGPDEADVIFFEKSEESYGGMKDIEAVRGFLLQDDNIRKAYESTTQYPEWIPHLTLGYPDSPAKKDKRDYPGINWVNFDRLALWTGDFIGGEIPLKSDDRRALSMSDLLDEPFLAHYGKKGMKWGVRKSVSTSSGSTSAKAVAKKTETGDTGPIYTSKGGRIIKVDPATGKATSTKLTDDELRQAISRIDMERKYATLTAAAPSKKAQAAKIVGDVLLDVAKQQAKAALMGVTTKELQKRGIVAPPKAKKD